ncbi:DUF397 domain-containing protein [Streptomyces guryensis]|uniref:DUF397 domain-containing protein n=1 Tax=Streptomyces guryensis TaxID=2886947 RepID=A0A9Q3ZDC5_9ACTN|nr:DUF397 domain-containing protein [Streptomyces guryensis]MCD9880557.1 DUF397 domain-containing protein [Streptomyces guryensis]
MIRKTAAGDASELVWFKSSYSSGTDGNSCVEVALGWSKSSYSSSSEGDSCVEVATTPGAIHVRDSKHTAGPQLALAPQAWSDFVTYASEA